MNAKRNAIVRVLALLACSISLIAPHLAFCHGPDQLPTQKSAAPTDEQLLDRALCPIVYQVDRFLSPRGYRYLFYGNGFFINNDGYLLTDAHVLSQLHGGQPYVLLHSPLAPPHFVQANVVAIDREHDVAILRATPNPFNSSDSVAFLPLALESTMPGKKVLAAALRPSRPRDAWSREPVPEERSPGEILRFEFSQLEKGRPDTELFLFNHIVQLGQSGAPVISQDSHEVVGLIEGQWLRDNSTTFAAPENKLTPRNLSAASSNEATAVPGAVIPIHYAIALLQRRNIVWHGTEEDALTKQHAESDGSASAPPAPLSLIPPPYPPQSLFGGEVLLDALVGRNGMLSDIKIDHGEQPFLEKALAATRTWTFIPARAQAPVEAKCNGIDQECMPRLDHELGFRNLIRRGSDAIRKRLDESTNCAEDDGNTNNTGAHAKYSVVMPPHDGALYLSSQVRSVARGSEINVAADERYHVVLRKISPPDTMPARDLCGASQFDEVRRP